MHQFQCSDKNTKMKINMINNPKLLILKHMFDIKGISEENLENLTKNQYEIYRDCIESYRFGVAFIDYLQCLREEKCNWGLKKDMLEFCQTREAMTRFIDFCAELRSKKKIYQKIYNTFGSECEELATIVLRWSMHDGFDDAEKLKNSLDNIIDFLIAVMPQLGIKNVRKLTLPKLMPFWSKEYLILGVKAFNIGKEVIKTVEDLGLLLEEMQKYISASYINIDDNTHLNHEDKKYYRICSTFHPFKNIEHELMKNLIIQSKVAHVDIILEKIAQHGEVCGRYRM